MRAVCLAAAMGLALAACPAGAADRIILRDLTILTDRTVSAFDEDGVQLDDGALLTWDRIERGTIAPDQQKAFDQLRRDVGQPLYRLRLRLRVGDDAGLRELAESLAPRFAERNSASSYLVHRALMRGRLAAGEREAAVEPYLHCLAYVWHQPGGRPEIPAEQRMAIDPQTGLCAELLAVWFDSTAAQAALPGVRQAAARVAEPRPDGLRVYFASLALAAGDLETAQRVAATITPTAGQASDWRDTLLVALEQQTAESKTTAGKANGWGPAAERLDARAHQLGNSCRPVAYYWLGRAGLGLDNSERNLDAILRLLTLPAAYGTDHPELAAAALVHSGQALEQLGDAAGSAAIRRELSSRYGHTRVAKLADAGANQPVKQPETSP